MPKFTVIDKLGMSYSIESDYVIATTETCGIVSFVNEPTDDYSMPKVIAQFKLDNITGFFNDNSGSIKEGTDED